MARNLRIASVVVDLVANSARYVAGLREANRDTQRYTRSMQRSFGNLSRNIAGMAAGYLGVSAAINQFNKSLANAKEIEILSALAGQSVEDFQAAAYATNQFGISAEKLGDISKDVADKLGAFILTGGGEFKDFFEQVAPKVGLTAQELQGLSGPDVLLRVKKAMDDANVPMTQQVTLLEAIANDAAKLIPLLADSGSEYHRLGKEAHAANLVMSQADISALKESGQILAKVGQQIRTGFASAVVSAADEISYLGDLASRIIIAIGDNFDSLKDTPKTLGGITTRLGILLEQQDEMQAKLAAWKGIGAFSFWDALTGGTTSKALAQKELQALSAKIERLKEQRLELQTPVTSELSLDHLTKNLATEQELIDKNYKDQIDKINNLVLTEIQIKKAGFDSLEELQADFLLRNKNAHTQATEKLKADTIAKAKEEAAELIIENKRVTDGLKSTLMDRSQLLTLSYADEQKAIKGLVMTNEETRKLGYQNVAALQEAWLKASTDNYKKAQEDITSETLNKQQRLADSLQQSLSSEQELLKISHEEQKKQIRSLVLTEVQLRALGFESIEALQKDWLKRSRANYKQAVEDLEEDLGKETEVAGEYVMKLAETIGAELDVMANMAENFAYGFSTELANMAMKGEADFGKLAQSIISDILRIAIQAKIVQPLMQSMGILPKPSAPKAPVIAGGNATGGPVQRGSTYLVGEKGPELFTASNSGNIIPNHNMGGTTTVNIYTQPGETAETRTQQTEQGDIIEVFMKQVDSRMNEQISRGQGLARTLESRYALSRKSY